jgi:hypothetical protein
MDDGHEEAAGAMQLQSQRWRRAPDRTSHELEPAEFERKPTL